MTTYICRECDEEFPASQIGSCFILAYDGRRCHLCSSACLRAYANNQPLVKNPIALISLIWFLMGTAGGATLMRILIAAN